MADTGVDHTRTFIEVSPDTRAMAAVEPPVKATPSVARRQYELLAAEPYALTSADVIFTVHAERTGIPPEQHEAAREEYFSVGRACLRASPLVKTYGWGLHADEEGRLALVPYGSPEYERLAADAAVDHLRGMRSSKG